ncbi:MAG: DUF998 domain-containing protein [Clostridiales bacterium]|jgi:hypothetical membrane protein|nr:DUF998 domain-containing protein [Clostridiales bacterium]
MKRKSADFRYLLSSFLLLLPVMLVLPFFSVDTYSIIRNTTSHLGAQSTPNAWIMNAAFVLVGLSSILEGWLHLRKMWFHRILLSIFGFGLIMVAVFRHAPIVEGIEFDAFEDKLHSIFASLVGFMFTVLAISTAFIEKALKHRITDIAVGLAATLLSVLMQLLPAFAGLWQRAIFIMSFTWLIFMLERMRAFDKDKSQN